MYLVSKLAVPILVIIVILAFLGCRNADGDETTKISLALDWYPWANHAGLFVADRNGHFDSHGLEVDLYTPSDPSIVLQTVGAGKDDFGISYQTDVIMARAQGIPVVSIAGIVQHPLNSVMALQNSRITSPKLLEGKKVGYPGIPNNIPLLRTMVEGDGGNFDEVELVNVGFDLVPALISGKVDAIVGAYWVHESILIQKQTGHDPIILKMEEWGVPDFYELVLVASEETVNERSELVARFLSAVIQGYSDAANDIDLSVEILANANPEVDRELEEESLQLLVPLWVGGIPSFGWQTSKKWENFVAWMINQGDLASGFTSSNAFTNKFMIQND